MRKTPESQSRKFKLLEILYGFLNMLNVKFKADFLNKNCNDNLE